MEKLIIKPFAPLTILVDEKKNIHLYGIMRYNATKGDWEILKDTFTDKQEAFNKIDTLNEDAGNIAITIE